MTAEGKRFVVAGLGLLFLGSLVVVAYRESKTEHGPHEKPQAVVPADSSTLGCAFTMNNPFFGSKLGAR